MVVLFVMDVWECWVFFRERMLNSMNCWGSCSVSMGGGKLYFGVVVIGYCAFTKIHQYVLFGGFWYLSVVHEQFAQYNKQ